MGSITYTKPLFRLVKCHTCTVRSSVRNAVSDESLNGFKVLDSRSRSSGLKSDEFQRCSEVEMFFQIVSGKRAKKEIC